MITLKQYWMGRDTMYPTQLTDEIIGNANNLLIKVNKLMELANRKEVSVNSGWRPPAINKAVGGAFRSNHMLGNAIDLSDDDGSLDDWCMRNLDKLKQTGLYLEHPSKTPRWCHLQQLPPKSGNIVFMP